MHKQNKKQTEEFNSTESSKNKFYIYLKFILIPIFYNLSHATKHDNILNETKMFFMN